MKKRKPKQRMRIIMPPQPKRKRETAGRWKKLLTIWGIIFTVVFTVIPGLAFYQAKTQFVPEAPLQSSSFATSPFRLKNESFAPIHDVQIMWRMDSVKSDDRYNRSKGLSWTNVLIASDFSISKIKAGDSATIPHWTEWAFGQVAGPGVLSAEVSFKYFGIRKKQNFRFETTINSKGEAVWFVQPADLTARISPFTSTVRFHGRIVRKT